MDSPLSLVGLLACPSCHGDLAEVDAGFTCARCAALYPSRGPLPCLIPNPSALTETWAREAGLFATMMDRALQRIETDLARLDLLPATRLRLQMLRDGNREHRAQLLDLLAHADVRPSPPPVDDDLGDGPPGSPALVEHYDAMLRDWAWTPDGDGRGGQNQVSLEALLAANGDRPLGNMVVLGAGAARLAYDFHLAGSASVTVAVDANPLPLILAHQVLDGRAPVLHEFPLAPRRPEQAVIVHRPRWSRGGRDRFHLLLADARAHPFRPGIFDTVVTPWFIDAVAVTVSEVVALVHGLLAPGGRWLHHGPLVYPGSRAPAERLTMGEVEALLPQGGFDLAEVTERAIDHLDSPHGGRARRETVYTFAATRRATFDPADDDRDPPAWLLVPHRPVPQRAFLDKKRAAHPLAAVVADLIDGQRSTTDIASALVGHPALPAGSTPEAAARALLFYLWSP